MNIRMHHFNILGRQRPLIAGSIGPYGVLLCDGSEYSGSYMTSVTKSQIEAMHLPRIMSLVDGGADLLAVETMPCLEEVKIILDLIKEHSPESKVWVSFSIKVCNTDFYENHYEIHCFKQRYLRKCILGRQTDAYSIW